jgi:hypothetical protein
MTPIRFAALPTVFLVTLVAACGGGGASGPAAPVPVPSAAPTIGAAGGTVNGAAATLVVPANALASPVAVSVRGTTSVPLDPYAAVGTAVDVGPAGTAFAAPATLVLRYTAAQAPWGIDEGELRLHELRGGAWAPLAGSGVNPSAREVAAPIMAAGVYGVRWIGPAADCRSREDRQFDFWIGSWNLLLPGGALSGTNDITRNGCVIEEEFHAGGGSIGRSVSFWSPRDAHWYQTYIDSMGNRLALRGVLEGSDMVLYHDSGGRSTWSPLSTDRVRFYQEAPNGGGWRIGFDSTYTRR